MVGARGWIEVIEQSLGGGVEEWEVFWARSHRTEAVARGDEELRSLTAVSEAVGLRVLRDGRVGFSFAVGPPTREAAGRVVEMALAAAEAAEVVEGFSFADPPVELPEAEEPDREIEMLGQEGLRRLALELGARALGADKRIVQVYPAQVGSYMKQVVVANSRGVYLTRREASLSAFLEVVASDGSRQESAWDMAVTRRLGQMDIGELGASAAREAVELLGAGPVEEGVYDVIFHPRAATGLLELVGYSLRADNMHKGRSMFLGRHGEKVVSQLVEIIDDPLLPGGVVHRAFDDEASASRRLTLVERGRVVGLVCDRYWGAKTGGGGVGGCVRAGATSPPGVGFTNLVLRPGGGGGLEEMARELGRGLVITQLMGLHTADPVSGRLSVGACGYLVEGGEMTRGVKSIAIAGQLGEIFARLKAVGSEVVFKGNVGSPAIAVEGISVSAP